MARLTREQCVEQKVHGNNWVYSSEYHCTIKGMGLRMCGSCGKFEMYRLNEHD